MENINIKKRNGKLEKFNILKIQAMSNFACKNTTCNPLELESALPFSIKEGMETRYIHSQMTYEAINKIDPKNDQWRIVAGRLQIMEFIKTKNLKAQKLLKELGDENYENYDLEKSDFSIFLNLMFYNNNYDIGHFKNHSLKDLNEYWNDIVDITKNFDYFIESVITLENKFLIDLETPQHMYFVISLIYTNQYFKRIKQYTNKDYSKSQFKEKLKDYYDKISSKKLSFPSVILSELRKPNPNLASCFIALMPDELDSEYQEFETIDEITDEKEVFKTIKKLGIMDMLKSFALISKKGGGIGCSLDKIRAFKSWLMGVKGRATGIGPLMKILNDLMIYVNQSGVKDGAMTVALSAWHSDIITFLKTQQIGGEEREKSMDLFLQFVANDLFMDALDKDETWYLFDPYEIKKKFNKDLSDIYGEEFNKDYNFLVQKANNKELEIFTIMRSRDIFKEVLRTLINRGTPYFTFKDTINNRSNMKNKGTIYSLNLCVESYSVFDKDTTHTCNLLSVVHPFVNDDEYEEVVKCGIELLDLTIDLSTPPTKASRKHNKDIRAIGLGSMGLSDWNAKNCISYETKEGLSKMNARFEKLAYYSIEKSYELGLEYGSFGRFDESQWAQGNMLGKTLEDIKNQSNTDLDWDSLSEKVKTAMRNGWLLAIAPNTTSSSAIGVGSSILPTYAKLFIEETKVGNIPRMPLYIKEYPLNYKEYKYVDMFKMNDVISTIQFWTDAGISYEPLFDLNQEKYRSSHYIMDFYIDAWKKKIQAIYYARWIKPGQNKVAEKKECIGCAG